jgi:hypothetical protein
MNFFDIRVFASGPARRGETLLAQGMGSNTDEDVLFSE